MRIPRLPALAFSSLLWVTALPGIGRALDAPAQGVGGGWEEWPPISGAILNERLGAAVAAVGDTDGDGIDDYAVSAPGAGGAGMVGAGEVRIYSGATGAMLLHLPGAQPSARFGGDVAGLGDVDGDGLSDFVASSPSANANGRPFSGEALVFSGATGGTIFTVGGYRAYDQFGTRLAGLGDHDGDGVPDFGVGAPFGEGNGRRGAGVAYVFSGATGSRIWRSEGDEENMAFGCDLAKVGDLNGDHVPEFAVSAPNADLQGSIDVGAVYVYDGATGALLHATSSFEPGSQFGVSMAEGLDVDRDGWNDLIVGARMASPGGLSHAGSAFVLSALTGEELWREDGEAEDDCFGTVVGMAFDVTADGTPDPFVGAPGAGASRAGMVYVYCGWNGRLFKRFEGTSADGRFGAALTGVPNLAGPRLSGIVIGAPRDSGPGPVASGTAQVFLPRPYLTASRYAISAAAGGIIDLGIDFGPERADESYLVLCSGSGRGPNNRLGFPVPLGVDVYFWNSLNGVFPSYTTGFTGVLDGLGRAPAAFHPAAGQLDPALVGRIFHFAVVAGPSSLWEASSVPVPAEVLP